MFYFGDIVIHIYIEVYMWHYGWTSGEGHQGNTEEIKSQHGPLNVCVWESDIGVCFHFPDPAKMRAIPWGHSSVVYWDFSTQKLLD